MYINKPLIWKVVFFVWFLTYLFGIVYAMVFYPRNGILHSFPGSLNPGSLMLLIGITIPFLTSHILNIVGIAEKYDYHYFILLFFLSALYMVYYYSEKPGEILNISIILFVIFNIESYEPNWINKGVLKLITLTR